MADLHPASSHPTPAAAALGDGAARWPAEDSDFALGCECADPSLQIERWLQEVSESSAGEKH